MIQWAVSLTQAGNTGEGRGLGETGSACLTAGSVCGTQAVVQFVEESCKHCHQQQDSSFVQGKFRTQAMKEEGVSGFLFYLVLGWGRCAYQKYLIGLYTTCLYAHHYLTCLGE